MKQAKSGLRLGSGPAEWRTAENRPSGALRDEIEAALVIVGAIPGVDAVQAVGTSTIPTGRASLDGVGGHLEIRQGGDHRRVHIGRVPMVQVFRGNKSLETLQVRAR